MQKNTIIFILVALVLLVSLFFFLKPKTSRETSMPNAEIKERVFEIVVKDEKIVSPIDTIQVAEGDTVVIKVTADTEDQLHLHGYDLHVDVKKDVPSELDFVAHVTGRFKLELHESKMDLVAIEVLPK
jgi:hypothetical protein